VTRSLCPIRTDKDRKQVDGQPRGYGTAATKQAAKEIAAKTALVSMGWLAA
jgi:hypothetical protein